MRIMKDKSTGDNKVFFTGREIIVAAGEKYNQIHDMVKDHYDDLYDSEQILQTPLFNSVKDIVIRAENGFYKLKLSKIENKYIKRQSDKITNIRQFKIKHHMLSDPIKMGLTVFLVSPFYFIGLFSTIVFILRFIGFI